MKSRIFVLAALFAFALSTFAVAQTAPDTVKKAQPVPAGKIEKTEKIEGGKPGMEKPGMARMKEETMAQRISSASSLKTFAQLLKDAGVEATLTDNGVYTVFAPNDAAFNKLPADTLNALKQDKARLATILKNHIVSGRKIGMKDLVSKNAEKIVAESGLQLNVSHSKDKWMVGEAALTGINMRTTNGPIHEIDTVILTGAAPAPEAVKMPPHEKKAAVEKHVRNTGAQK